MKVLNKSNLSAEQGKVLYCTECSEPCERVVEVNGDYELAAMCEDCIREALIAIQNDKDMA